VRLEFDPECFDVHQVMRLLTVLVQRSGGAVTVTQRELAELGEELDFSLAGSSTDLRVEVPS
jgi:hypothetical protein